MSSPYILDDILDPFGKGVSAYNKNIIFQAFFVRYMNIRNKIKYALSIENGVYSFHYMIPSESRHTTSKFYYDVVIEFSTDRDDIKNMNTLSSYNVRVFSNSPDFSFTYTYVWNKFDGIILWLKNKCGSLALKRPPLEKNPNLILGFSKTLWFAAISIKKNGLLNKSYLHKLKTVKPKSIFNNVRTQEQKLAERIDLDKKSKAEETKSKNKIKNDLMKKQITERKVKKMNQIINKPTKNSVKPKLAKSSRQARKSR